jgi:O-acetyl-ADP-ribose deacetylase (regulator of RNase III)
MFTIEYKKGDLFNVPFNEVTLVPHIVNSGGSWGSGFVLAISKQSRWPEKKYREWYKAGFYYSEDSEIPFMLGEIQVVPIDQRCLIVNMIGQKDVGFNKYNMPPIRYDCLEECLSRLRDFAESRGNLPIRSPKFGAGLAGGSWDKIAALINKVFANSSVQFTVYEL